MFSNYEVGSTVWVFFLPHDIEGVFVGIGKAHLCGKKDMKLVLSTRRLQVTPVSHREARRNTKP